MRTGPGRSPGLPRAARLRPWPAGLLTTSSFPLCRRNRRDLIPVPSCTPHDPRAAPGLHRPIGMKGPNLAPYQSSQSIPGGQRSRSRDAHTFTPGLLGWTPQGLNGNRRLRARRAAVPGRSSRMVLAPTVARQLDPIRWRRGANQVVQIRHYHRADGKLYLHFTWRRHTLVRRLSANILHPGHS